MPSRIHWDRSLPKAAAFNVPGKFFLASGLCGRALGRHATADLVKRIPDSSAWDSTPIIIAYDESGGRWDHTPPPTILAMGLLPQDLRGRF
jgi:phospholipase C